MEVPVFDFYVSSYCGIFDRSLYKGEYWILDNVKVGYCDILPSQTENGDIQSPAKWRVLRCVIPHPGSLWPRRRRDHATYNSLFSRILYCIFTTNHEVSSYGCVHSTKARAAGKHIDRLSGPTCCITSATLAKADWLTSSGDAHLPHATTGVRLHRTYTIIPTTRLIFPCFGVY